jgi:hypothetical protein
VHSFWTPVRILDKLRSTVEELEKEDGIKISTNQLAMDLLDVGLDNEDTLLNTMRIMNRKKKDNRRNALSGSKPTKPTPETAAPVVVEEVATTTGTRPQGTNQEEVKVV